MSNLQRRRAAAIAVAAFTLSLIAIGTSPVAAQDVGWPREISTPTATIVIYQPQVDSLTEDILSGRAAVSMTGIGVGEPTFGSVWFVAKVATDRDAGTAEFTDIHVTKVRFPDTTPEQEQQLIAILEPDANRWDLTMSLAELTTSLEAAQEATTTAANLKSAPPRIVFSQNPAVLVLFDGKPELRPVPGTEYQRVVNTPYAVVYDPNSQDYYLAGGRFWYIAKAATGPWGSISRPPAAVAELVPPDTSSTAGDRGAPPEILTATVPTELVVTEGTPTFAPLAGTDLLYISNTESDLFKDIASQDYFLLISGRWYKSRTTAGPWIHVRPDQLPGTFQDIPPDSPKGDVLTSVPGTPEADDALADAQIPQTAAISRSEAQLTVEYDGKPKFQKIEGTDIELAVNSGTTVLKMDGLYYACENAVWFVASSATGPWVVSDSVPKKVETIPPSSPAYNVKYVRVYQATPDVVYVGYTPGYLGAYPYYGTVVYGTGWYYRPYLGPRYYYPRPCTWGFYARYRPWAGWTYGYGWSIGFMQVGWWWNSWYYPRPHWGGGGGWGWYGPGGYRPTVIVNRPSRITIINRTVVVHRSVPRSPDVRVIPIRSPGRNIYNRSGTKSWTTSPQSRTGDVARPIVRPAPKPDNVFVDRKGSVYRRMPSGWESREGQAWRPVEDTRPAPALGDRPVRVSRPGKGDNSSPAPQPTPKPAPDPDSPHKVRSGPTPPAAVAPSPRSEHKRLERDYQARERGAEQARGAAPSRGSNGGGRPRH
jgi:hypothetical protein